MLEALAAVDSWAPARHQMHQIAQGTGCWAGLPMPVGDLDLVIEPKFPEAEKLMEIAAQAPKPEVTEDANGARLRNSFWSERWRCEIIVWEEDGRIYWGPWTRPNQLDEILGTIGASFAWGIEQEQRALKLLGTMIRHHTFKCYLLTGSFLETSERSGITYLFRKLRPTVALSDRDKRGVPSERMRAIAALCLHPIGYYQGTWAGAMCPTDDVIAHLMMMRGDEPKFWARANQHRAIRPEAGL